jgi:hypothetical protein
MLVDPSKGLDMLIDAIDLSSALDKLIDVVNMSYVILDMLYGMVNTFKGRRPVKFCCQPVHLVDGVGQLVQYHVLMTLDQSKHRNDRSIRHVDQLLEKWVATWSVKISNEGPSCFACCSRIENCHSSLLILISTIVKFVMTYMISSLLISYLAEPT